jgi:transcriptional regulator of acetoin/glycerol metabolism
MKPLSTRIPQTEKQEVLENPVKISWEDVVLEGHKPHYPIRPEILKSWRKCRAIGVDPFSKNSPPILSNKQLNKLLRQNRKFIEISKPVMDMIQISLRETGFIITLIDKDGYVLVVRGDKDIMKMAKENYYQPGCLRTVEHAGTNAIGVCLLEGKPIQLTGAEHYKVYHHPWTCSSAPVYDRDGKIIGAITLSGKSIGRHKHTLALVIAAAETIEGRLRERELMAEKQRLSSIISLIFNAISDGVIGVDNNLDIVRINKTAGEMLGLDVETTSGRRLTEIIQPEISLIQAIKNRKSLVGQVISFVCPNGHKSYVCSLDPLMNASGHILGAIIKIAEKRRMINITKKLSGNYAKYEFRDIKGNSRELKNQIKMAKIAAKTNSRVLIIGESGTGKELFAQAIHNHSSRKNEPFVAISCAAIPRDLIESELFGYRGGAFTGARKEGQLGKFELANKGTLFLDEIDGLPLDLQAKLLRVLQQNEIRRLGGSKTLPIDVRVIAASNADLMREIEHGNFREDLYYRISVVEITIPPLRDRIEDLELLVNHIINRQSQEMGFGIPKISKEVLEVTKKYHWPGNVRELENCLEQMVLISQGEPIRKDHLPVRLSKKRVEPVRDASSLHEVYKQTVEATLDRCKGNISVAAKELKIARSTLYRKMKEFELL